MFETWQIALSETQKANQTTKIGELGFKALQNLLVNLIGLNIEPVVDDSKPLDKDGKPAYRWPIGEEFTPLILAIARPDYVKQAMDKITTLTESATAESTESDYSEDDLQFFDDLPINEKQTVWNSAEFQNQLKSLVIMKDSASVDPFAEKIEQPVGPTAEDKKRLAEEQAFNRPRRAPAFKVDADTEDLLDFGELKKDI